MVEIRDVPPTRPGEGGETHRPKVGGKGASKKGGRRQPADQGATAKTPAPKAAKAGGKPPSRREASGRSEPQVQAQPEPPYPKQKLAKPGVEAEMEMQPRWRAPRYKAAGKLEGKVALVTGGDSGIGRSVAYLFAREGADVAISYLPAEQEDAEEVRAAIEEEGCRCMLLPGDLMDPAYCRECVEATVRALGGIDILVSNAAWQNRFDSVVDVPDEEWRRTQRVNIDAYFHLVKAAVPHMKPGSAIIASSSQVGLVGSKELPAYAASKGAIIAFTKTLALELAEKGIRANVVAPGPVWTPLNPADEGLEAEHLAEFGKKQPLGRAAQPEEVAPAYVFLASDADSSYVTGIVLEEMGGMTHGG